MQLGAATQREVKVTDLAGSHRAAPATCGIAHSSSLHVRPPCPLQLAHTMAIHCRMHNQVLPRGHPCHCTPFCHALHLSKWRRPPSPPAASASVCHCPQPSTVLAAL